MAARTLDFIVIGVQKGGTTSLWHFLRHHPRISMPRTKEEPFFCKPGADRPGALDEYLHRHFPDAPGDALLGTATPQYMMGNREFDVEEIAERISIAVPNVRLIALLRDPIERATSQYLMSVRRGWEPRSFEQAVEDQLDPEWLRAARSSPTEVNSYVTQGEYGRTLAAYRARFPADQLHVEMTADLGRDAPAVLARCLTFLSASPDFRPPRLDARLHRGGPGKLLDAESEAGLREFMAENVWPNLGDDAARVKRLFGAFLAIWNVAPSDERPSLSAETRARLEDHYRADAEKLVELGVTATWVESWQAVPTP